MRMTDAITPSILLSETHFPCRYDQGVVPDAVARVADEGFFRSIEISDVPDARDRKRIGQVVRDYGLAATQWMSNTLVHEGLNLSSIDEVVRKKSVARMIEMVEPAIECAVTTLAVLPGPDPGPPVRAQATEALYASLTELCEALAARSEMRLALEPLDREAHKNGLLGPTREFVALFGRLRETFPSAGVSWDTAHVALCGDDVFASFDASRDVIAQIHLANAVLDSDDSRFGDHHMEIGPPGFLTVETIARLFRRGIDSGFLPEKRPPVAIEVRTLAGCDPWRTAARGQAVLEGAWALYEKERDAS